MIYKYLLVYIHSSDSFFWVDFISCVIIIIIIIIIIVIIIIFQLYCSFLWMGFNCLKAAEPLRRGTLLFTTKLPSILSFPKKLLPTVFQFACMIANSEKCTLANCALSINYYLKRGWASINFNFCAW